VLVALLLWWAPTPATRDPALALILIALLAAGTEALRRQIKREHPDADMAEANERMRERARRGVTWVRQGGSAGAAAVAGTASRVVTEAKSRTSAGAAEDERLEQLERLGRLKQSGVLDQHEFAAQKELILAGAHTPSNGEAAGSSDTPPPLNADA
jgi:hypothetical protein